MRQYPRESGKKVDRKMAKLRERIPIIKRISGMKLEKIKIKPAKNYLAVMTKLILRGIS